VPATVGWARWGREQGLDQCPQLVRHEVLNKSRHGAGSCQIHPTGAKRRLKVQPDEMAALGVGEPEFFDLRQPRLYAPR
jgi:hypothetical protein